MSKSMGKNPKMPNAAAKPIFGTSSMHDVDIHMGSFLQRWQSHFFEARDIYSKGTHANSAWHNQPKLSTPPKFNIDPEKWWLEDYFPIGKATFQGLC